MLNTLSYSKRNNSTFTYLNVRLELEMNSKQKDIESNVICLYQNWTKKQKSNETIKSLMLEEICINVKFI